MTVKPWMLGVWLVLFIGAWITSCRIERNRIIRETDQQIAKKDQELTKLRADSARLAGQFRVDTLVLTKWKDRWKSLTDTLHLSDTVLVPGPIVKEIVRVGDSTVAACEATVKTRGEQLANCEERAKVLSSQRDAALKQVAALKRPRRFGCSVGLSYTVGDIRDHRSLSAIADRVGGTCGVTFRF